VTPGLSFKGRGKRLKGIGDGAKDSGKQRKGKKNRDPLFTA